MSLVISRHLLTDVSTHLALLPDNVSQEVSHFALDVIQPRVISFEEQVIIIFTTLCPTIICELSFILFVLNIYILISLIGG